MKMNMQIINKMLEERHMTKYDLLMECASGVMRYFPDDMLEGHPDLILKNEIVIQLYNDWRHRKSLN